MDTRWVALAMLAFGVACLESPATLCDNGRICPPGTVCEPVEGRCVLPEQTDACAGEGAGAGCDFAGTEGTCQGGVCVPLSCGDGVLSASESCDGDDLGDKTCLGLGFYSAGGLACTESCTLDLNGCSGICGDGNLDAVEACDGDKLGGKTCATFGYYNQTSGLACNAACTFDTKGCVDRCGDGVLNGNEQCDDGDLGGSSCADLDFYSETSGLACSASCTFDTAGCSERCGDGILNGTEECDGNDLGTADCKTLEFYQASGLGCTAQCFYDAELCKGFCGDDTLNGDEICELDPPPGETCLGFGFDAGRLGCSSVCTPGFSSCGLFGWRILHAGDGGVGISRLWVAGSDDMYGFDSIVGGSLRHFDGGSWSLVTTPGPANVVDGVDGQAVFAVGDGGAISFFNGSSWSPMDSKTDADLHAVSAAARDDVFAVGSGGVILHYDGTNWTPMLSGTNEDLRAVGGDSNHAFAAGASILLEFDGSDWSTLDTAGASVGGDGTIEVSSDGSALLLHWLGTATVWNGVGLRQIPALSGLGGMWGTSASHLLAVVSNFETGLALAQYDGTRWTAMTLPAGLNGQDKGHSVARGPSGTVYATVDDTVLRYGVAYRPQTSFPVTLRDGDAGLAGNGAVWGSSAADVYVVGEAGVMQHFDGTSWQAMDLGVPLESWGPPTWVSDVWGTAAGDVLAGDGQGNVYHWNGSSWSAGVATGLSRLAALWGSGPDSYFAGGSSGQIAHYNGATWAPMTSNTTDWINDIWGLGSDRVFATTSGGEVLEYNGVGESWTSTVVSTSDLTGIWGSSPNDVFVVSEYGEIFHFDGTIWAEMDTGSSAYLNGIIGFGPDDVFVVGENAVLLHYDGVAWNPVASGTSTSDDLFAIWGTPGDLFVVGQEGGYASLARTRTWSCRTNELACGDAVDDDCDGQFDSADPDCAGALRFSEIHGGDTDFVELTNPGSAPRSLVGITIAFRGSCDPAAREYTFRGDAVIQPGEVFRMIETKTPQQREHFSDQTYCQLPDEGGWYALCAGPCDLEGCTNVLDYVEQTGASSPPISPPACASFSPAPLDVSAADSSQSAHRVGATGIGASGQAADWQLGPSSRD